MPTLNPLNENRYRLAEAFAHKDVTVPAGFTTNGANIPRIFWSIVPPFTPKFMPAIVVHDYLCEMEEYIKADKYFEELLFAVEKSARTRVMVMAVRLYHRVRYGTKKKG